MEIAEVKLRVLPTTGQAPVDNGIVNTRLFDKINSFEIIQRVESDHVPICCRLRISYDLPRDPMDTKVHLQPLTWPKFSNKGTKHFWEIDKKKKQIKIEFFI